VRTWLIGIPKLQIITFSENYTVLLSQIAPKECTLKDVETVLREKDLEKRAELFLNLADKIGCRKFVTAKDIIEGNPRLNLAFVATLFNKFPSLGKSFVFKTLIPI
jgi:hypothetical protein